MMMKINKSIPYNMNERMLFMLKEANKKMPIQLVRYIEHLIETYPFTEKYLKSIKEELGKKTLNISIFNKDPQFTSPIEEEIRLERLENIVHAVRRALNSFSNNEKPYLKLIELKYWNKYGDLTMDGISMKIHVSRRTAYNMKNQIIYKVAKELGEWI
jgi:RinA family phage transcriptional activator